MEYNQTANWVVYSTIQVRFMWYTVL